MKVPQLLIRDHNDLFQRDVSSIIQQVGTNPLLNGILLENITIPGVTLTRVNHPLNRPYRGYIVVYQNAETVLWVDETGNAERDKYLGLMSSATVTVSLWVF